MKDDVIVTTNLQNVNMSSSFLVLKSPNGEIEIDIKKLLNAPIDSDDAYFNATQIAKMYNVRLMNIFRTEEWQEYVAEMEKQLNFKYLKNETIKKPIKLIITRRGKYHSGTWLHSKLVVAFIRKLDVKFAVAMDLFIQDLIKHANAIKIERTNTKFLFKELTDTIKDIWIPAQISDNAKKFAYNNIATLINTLVLGTTSSKYAKDNNIEIENGKSIRDYLSKEQLEQIKQLEIDCNGLIKYAKITDYDKLKEELKKYV